MKDRKQYDAVNHLNHVNSLHSRIKAQYKRYRSVASKYINRYAVLFRIQELYRKTNGQEIELVDEAQAENVEKDV